MDRTTEHDKKTEKQWTQFKFSNDVSQVATI